MPKKRDPNQLASSIVDQLTGAEKPAEEKQSKEQPQKNPAAVALGRLGGLAGGPARAKALTKKDRQAIAQKAAKARWKAEK